MLYVKIYAKNTSDISDGKPNFSCNAICSIGVSCEKTTF